MIYRHLRATGVPNLPKVIHAGDVKTAECVQETVNHTLLSDPRAKSWRRPTDHIRHMIHFRLVSELLIPLESVESAEDLLLVGRDILHSEYPIIQPRIFPNLIPDSTCCSIP